MTGRFRQALLEKGTMPKKFSVKSGDKSAAGGLTAKGVKRYRAANPGSKLKTAVTTKPSKLKKGSKAASRRKSFCARMGGMKKRRTSAKTANDPNSRINKALRKWNCSTDVNPNALQAMSEAIHFRVFESQIDERVMSLIECVVNSADEITQELLDDAYLMESVLTPIVIEELNNPLNESSEDLYENIFRRMGAGLANAGAKVATGLGRAGYRAASKVGKGLGRAAYQGVKNFYSGLSGDTPIGQRLGSRLRGGLQGARTAGGEILDKGISKIPDLGYKMGKAYGNFRKGMQDKRMQKRRDQLAQQDLDAANAKRRAQRLSQQGTDVRELPLMSKEDAQSFYARRAAAKKNAASQSTSSSKRRSSQGDDDTFGSGLY